VVVLSRFSYLQTFPQQEDPSTAGRAEAGFHPIGSILAILTVFVQCYNRPTLGRQAIASALRQTNRAFRLVVSDNSTNDELFRLVQTEFPGVEYRRRVPSLPALDHFNLSISETDTDFVCLFHDDDLMEPEYVEVMLKTIERYPQAVAYACNAVTIDEEVVRKGSFFESGDDYVIVSGPRALAGRYFSKYPNGFAPFPAYIYRTPVVKRIPLDPHTGGKYSDVSWLLEISKIGPIVWNSRKLMRYRMHAANDSNLESLRDRLMLLGFLKLNKSFVGQAVINDCRFGLYKNLRKRLLTSHGTYCRHRKFIDRYLLKYRFKRFAKPETYAYLLYKFRKLFGYQ
jgi:glycosyltransferase involved in cell wall biosynthesis